MRDAFCHRPLWECNRELVEVAQGRRAADVVVRGARLVSVTSGEVIEDADVAVACGRVAYLGLGGRTAGHCVGEGTRVIDAGGAYLAPAFIDAHVHVESAMVGPAEYARAVVPHGTSAIAWDPHEAMNVAGMDALDELLADAARVPLKCMVTPGSCVPAVPGFEDTGSSVGVDAVRRAMGYDEVVGLGEMMNDPGVLACDDLPMGEVSATLEAGKVATGHFTVRDTDRQLNAYVAAGISCCHESVSAEEAAAKVRLGQYALLREGSAWQNLADLAPVAASGELDTRLMCLVTDDCHPSTLLAEGHLDRVLRMAVACGIDAVTAVQMVTINAAECFGLAREMGSVTPGKCADLVLLEDLEDFRVLMTMIDGEVVAEEGRALFDPAPYSWDATARDTMRVGLEIDEATFRIPAVAADGTPVAGDSAVVRAITSSSGSTVTREEHVRVPVVDGCLVPEPGSDVLKAFVFERHHATGRYAAGFAKGFGVHGALAQTVAHDAHNLLVVGDDDRDMALAARTLVECGGGEVAVRDGEVLGLVELPVFGIMSDRGVEEVAEQVAGVERAWAEMGCAMASPFMTMGLLSLACIPELRLTDRGYVDCTAYEFVPLVVEGE